MAVPSISLAGKIHRARFADHDDLDLAGILQLALDAAGELVGQLGRLAVVDRRRRHHDAPLPPGLDGVDLLHPGELARELLQLGQPLDVRLERLAPRTGARPRDGVRGLDDHADRRLDRKSTRLNSSHGYISYAVFCLKKKKTQLEHQRAELLSCHSQLTIDCSVVLLFFFFNDTATTEIYTLSLHDALPISGELARELLQLGQPLDVRLERLAPRTGARPRDGVRGLDDHADRRLVLDVVVVRRDAVDHDGMLAVLGRHLDAQLYMRAVVLVREHLADVVQQGAALGELDVELELRCDDPCEPGDFL